MARVSYTERQIGEINGIEVVRSIFGSVEGLPRPQPGKAYLVSRLILSALESEGARRSDVFAPDTGSTAIRDAEGRITGVTRLLGI